MPEESPVGGQAGAPNEEIEITPEMVEAGTAALWETALVEFPNPRDRLAVRTILEAALRLPRHPQ